MLFPSLRRRPTTEAKDVQFDLSTVNGLSQLLPWARRRNSRWPLERAVYEAYERTVWLWKGVGLKAGHAAGLPLKFRVPGSDTVVDDHPLTKLLADHSQVNPMEKGRAFKKRLFTLVQLSDLGVFVELTRSRGGDIIRLDMPSPRLVRPVPDAGLKMIDHYEVRMPDGTWRPVDVENMWWIREPHPLDPYRADTPLGPLGASVEMDDLARQINVNWMLNDGLIRAIVAVKGGVSDSDAAKIEGRFGVGPVDAGKVTVIGADDVSYADLSSRPRDLQYKQLSDNAKAEVLAGLGVPKSLLGDSDGTTFDNAAQDKYNYWSETMPTLLDVVAPELVDPLDARDLEPFFDTSEVEALKLPQQARRVEAREEVAAGLRSIESYAKLAGYGDEVLSTWETRALWLTVQGKEALPQTKEDVAAAEKEKQANQAMAAAIAAGNGPPPPPNGGKPPADGQTQQQPQQAPGKQPPAPATQAGRTPRAAGDAATQSPPKAGTKAHIGRARYAVVACAKASTAEQRRIVDVPIQPAADTIAAAMSALSAKWAARTVARLKSPKTRKGTRHWQADPAMPVDLRAGTKAIDVADVIDPAEWRADVENTIGPLVDKVASDTAASTATEMTGQPPSDTAPADQQGDHGGAGVVLGATVLAAAAAVLALLAGSAEETARKLAGKLADADKAGVTIDVLVNLVDPAALADWASRVGGNAGAAAATAGAYAAASLAEQAGVKVEATWRSQHDDHVRPTHRKADGQTRPLGKPFTVGEAKLRFPRDPKGPADETAGCRCGLSFTVTVPAQSKRISHDPRVERLRRWAIGPAGRARFGWGTDGDFAKCEAFFRKKGMPEHEIAGWCAHLHKLATGATPGHAPGEGKH